MFNDIDLKALERSPTIIHCKVLSASDSKADYRSLEPGSLLLISLKLKCQSGSFWNVSLLFT